MTRACRSRSPTFTSSSFGMPADLATAGATTPLQPFRDVGPPETVVPHNHLGMAYMQQPQQCPHISTEFLGGDAPSSGHQEPAGSSKAPSAFDSLMDCTVEPFSYLTFGCKSELNLPWLLVHSLCICFTL